MNNIIYTTIEPLNKSIVNLDNWPLFQDQYGENLMIYLKNAQEILEYENKHLFSPRNVLIKLTLYNQQITLPIYFIKKINYIKNSHDESININSIEIINDYTLQISSEYFNKYYGKKIIIEYLVEDYYNPMIEKSILIKTKELINM
jgi:hypothetical protein